MNFNCHLPLNCFKRMADGTLRISLDVAEIDQPMVLNTILGLEGQSLECEILSMGSLQKIKDMRKKADMKIIELATQRSLSKDEMKKKIFESMFNGRNKIRQLNEAELGKLIDSIDFAINKGA